MADSEKPFGCVEDGCKMAFTNEDHLNVHKKKHDIDLHLGIDTQNNTVADQTPTPTRFIRNCEEVGLFQDLQNVNPFDETFRKAAELANTGSLHVPLETSTDDSLHTPHIFPLIIEENNINKFSRINSNEPEFEVTTINPELLTQEPYKKEEDASKSNVIDDSEEEDLIIVDDIDSDSKSASDKLAGSLVPVTVTPITCSSNILPISSNILNNLSELKITIVPNNGLSKDETKLKVKEALKHKFKSKNGTPGMEIHKINKPNSDAQLVHKSIRIEEQSDLIQTENITSKLSNKQSQLERQREINRFAQIRSRQKKKTWIIQMEKDMDGLKEEKKELLLENQKLKNEIAWLKAMLLQHKDCPVSSEAKTTEELSPELRNVKEDLEKKIQEDLQKKMREELQKKNEKVPEKKVVQIRPNAAPIVALAPIVNSVLIQVPMTAPSSNTIQITAQPSGQSDLSKDASNVPKLIQTIIPGSGPAFFGGIQNLPVGNCIVGLPVNGPAKVRIKPATNCSHLVKKLPNFFKPRVRRGRAKKPNGKHIRTNVADVTKSPEDKVLVIDEDYDNQTSKKFKNG